ncbi:MAG: hypothetical protein ABIS68_06580, partial [Casimicrobiaceae bacterium]
MNVALTIAPLHAVVAAGDAAPALRVAELPAAGASQSTAHVRWDAFVAGCPDATFFHRAGWQAVIERVFGHRTYFLYAEAGG